MMGYYKLLVFCCCCCVCIGSSLFTVCCHFQLFRVWQLCVVVSFFPSSCDPRSSPPPRPPITGIGRRIRSRGVLLYMPLLFPRCLALTFRSSHHVPALRPSRRPCLFISIPPAPLPSLLIPSPSLFPPSFHYPSSVDHLSPLISDSSPSSPLRLLPLRHATPDFSDATQLFSTHVRTSCRTNIQCESSV